MGVYSKKRNDGSKAWYFDFQLQGKRYRAVGGTTKTEALRAQEKVRAEVLSGEYEFKSQIKNPTLEQFADKFLQRRIENRSYGRDVLFVKHLKRHFGNKRFMSSIYPENVEDYKSWRKTEGVANATVNREMACLKRMYNLAMQWGDAKQNPVQHIKFLPEPPKKDRFVTQEQAIKLIDAASNTFKPILITAFNTGMRLQEVLGLKWDMIRIWDIGGEIELVYTKNGKKRYVPLNKTMLELLKDIKQQNEFVFIGNRGEPLKSVRKPMETAIRRAGIEKATFHDLRHSWASWLSEQGVDPYTIMEIGGWADMKTLMRYLHRTRSVRQNAVEKLDGFLNQSLSKENKILEMKPAL